MSPFQRGKRWWTRIKGQDGKSVQRSLGTIDKSVAKNMEDAMDSLRTQREWGLINAMASGALPIGDVYDAVRMGTLDKLRARLSDVDLRTLVPRWERWAEGRASETSVAKYGKQVEHLLSGGSMRSDLSRAEVSKRLLALDVSGSTKKRYHAAWSSFFRYLVEIGIVDVNPMRSIQAPRPNPSRELWMDLNDMVRIVSAQEEPYRSLSAFLHGAGVEIGAALCVRVRDFNRDSRTVRARGTKTGFRDRLVRVDDWAWPIVLEATEGKMPDALVWFFKKGQDTSERVRQSVENHTLRVLRNALVVLNLNKKYTQHDARHSYAVRHVKLGTSYKKIAHNLGHADESQVIKVYGKHRLSDQEVANQSTNQEAKS